MNEEKEAVKSLIYEFFEAMDSQDLQMMTNITSHDPDMVNIGTDVGEFWIGWKHLKEDTILMFEGLKSYSADINNLRISLSKSDDVAWFSFILNTEVETTKEQVRTRNGRYTGVAEKRSGQWKLVQTHLSLPKQEQVVKY